jgi:hypothetical protein
MNQDLLDFSSERPDTLTAASKFRIMKTFSLSQVSMRLVMFQVRARSGGGPQLWGKSGQP